MELRRRFRVRALLALATAAQLLAISFGVSVLLHSAPTDAAQQVPYKVNFQGRLTDNSGNVLSDGLYNVKFRLWTLASGGSNVWEEDRVITGTDNRIQVTNGLFNIQFGDLTALSPALFVTGTGGLFLEVELPTPATANCATNGCAVFTEGAMTPRQALASSPYAMNSDTLDGLDSSAFGQLSANNTFTGANLFAPTTASTVALTVKATTAGSTNGLEVFDSGGTRRAFFDANGAFSTTALNAPSAGGTITTNAATLQRTASGTLTLDLNDSANTTLTVTNSGTGVANFNVAEGDLLTAGTSRLTNAGSLQNISNISQTGTYLLQNTANSTTAFRVLTSGGTPRTVLNVDTTNTLATLDANLIVNSSVNRPTITSVAFGSNSTGSLTGAPGTTYFYRIAAIVGSETAASIESWISTSAFTPLSAPSAPTAAAGASGGISGTYAYKYTYTTANGETTPSSASSNVSVSNKKITITIANGPTGTTGKKIYRTATGPGPTYLLVTTIADNTTTSYTDTTPDASLGTAAPGANTATTNLNSVSITFPSFPSATSYRIYRGTSSRGEDHYQTTATSPFTDTGTVGTAATPIEPTAGRVGIGTNTPGYTLDVAGNISSSNAYIQNGNVGQTSTCGAGSIFSGLTVSGGIITDTGSCASIGGGSASATLQSAYNNSSTPQIVLSTGDGALTVTDTAGGLGTDLLDVNNNAGTVTYLGVSATGISVTGSGTFTTGVNISTGQTYKINNVQIATSALSDVASITMQGNTFNGASGLVQLNGSTQLPAVSGTNLTNLNPSSLVQGSGAVTLQSANATALTLNSGTTGALNLATQGTGKTIQIGQTTAAVTDTIGIGNSAFAGSIDNITIGNQLTTSNTAIQGGTGANAVTLTPGTNGSVLAATTGTGTIEFNTAASVLVQSTTDSAKTFQIQNAATSTIFNVNTTDTNPVSQSGFETTPLTAWANLTGGTLAQDFTQHYVGFASGKVTAGTTIGGGISQPQTLTNGSTYTLSFYAKLDAASAAFTTLQAGYSNTGLAAGEVDCALNSSTVISAGWARYSCTFVAGSPSGSPYIYIEHNDTTSEVFYVDAVQIDPGSFATPYGSGKISLNANIDSPTNFQQSSNSTTAFQITNTVGTNILNVDTLNNNLSNQATNPSFESGTSGWAAKTGCTLTQDATGGYNGTSSAKCVNTATASAGMNMTGISPVMVSGTTYTISMYIKSSANMATLEIGRADNGAADTACLTGQTVTSLGWKRFSCTFTAGAQSGTPYIYVKQTDATARTIWVDAVLMETDANASSNYRDGRISLGNATISSPAVFQTNANSTTAFQIQNAAGIQVFNVDTASDTDLVANSGFEVNSVGWTLVNGASAPVRDTSKTYVGIASGKTTTTTTAGSGMRYTFAAQLPAAFYTISAYVQTSAADATFNLGYNNGADTNCVTISPAASATVPSTTGWTRFVCTTATSAVLNSIYITSGTTAVTLNVDAVRVESGATATAFGNSNISFNGVFTSPIAIRNPNDTTTEFQVQTGTSINLLTVDSLNKYVVVGGGFSTSDTTIVGLSLDSSSTFAETAGTCSNTANGGTIYFNSSTNAIRACIRDAINSGGNWEDLPSTAGLGAMLFGVVPDSGLTADQGDWTDIGGATKGPCKVSWASATTVSVAPCNAYSGGRKVTVASATVLTMPAVTAGQFVHVCFDATGTITRSAAGTELQNIPSFSANNPLLCLADVLAGGVNTTSKIYDLRTFTTTQKEFVVNQSTAAGLGQVVSAATVTPVSNGVTQMPSTTSTINLRGVVVATTGATSTTAINAIIAVRGPQWVKFAAAAGTLNFIIQPITGGVAGYPSSVVGASAGVYGSLGPQLRVSDNATCSSSANCQMSVPTDITIR